MGRTPLSPRQHRTRNGCFRPYVSKAVPEFLVVSHCQLSSRTETKQPKITKKPRKLLVIILQKANQFLTSIRSNTEK